MTYEKNQNALKCSHWQADLFKVFRIKDALIAIEPSRVEVEFSMSFFFFH